MIFKLIEIIALICKAQTNANPITFTLLTPILKYTVNTQKYPTPTIVIIENISVTKLIHLNAIF